MKLLLMALAASAMLLMGCGVPTKKVVYSNNPGWSVDGPDIICPIGQTCQIWKLTFNADNFSANGFQCIVGPNELGVGRLLAISPNDPRIVAVELGGGCYSGIESGEIVPTFRGGQVIK